MISLKSTGQYVYTSLEAVEFIYNGQYSPKDSIRVGNLKDIIDNKNNQGCNPMIIDGRDTSTEQFYLNICDSLFTRWSLPLLPSLPPPPPPHSLI